MASMGLDFRAPKKTAVEAWQVLALLYERGYVFRGCGCDAGGFIPPTRLEDVPAFLGEHYGSAAAKKAQRRVYARKRKT